MLMPLGVLVATWKTSAWKNVLSQSSSYLILNIWVLWRSYPQNQNTTVFSGLGAHLQWRDVLLTFLDDIGNLLRKACDHGSDAMHLRAAQVMCRKCLRESSHFMGHSSKDTREMLYHNHFWLWWIWFRRVQTSSIKLRLQPVKSHHFPYLSSWCPTVWNMHELQIPLVHLHLNRDQETTLPFYIAMKIHAVTYKRNLIDTSILGCMIPITISCNWHLTQAVEPTNVLQWMVLFVHPRQQQ